MVVRAVSLTLPIQGRVQRPHKELFVQVHRHARHRADRSKVERLFVDQRLSASGLRGGLLAPELVDQKSHQAAESERLLERRHRQVHPRGRVLLRAALCSQFRAYCDDQLGLTHAGVAREEQGGAIVPFFIPDSRNGIRGDAVIHQKTASRSGIRGNSSDNPSGINRLMEE